MCQIRRQYAWKNLWMVLLAALITVCPLAAQFPGGGRGRMGGGMGGGRRGGGGRERGAIVVEQDLLGPPTVETMRQITQLSTEQATTYETRWKEYATATTPERDSAQAALRGIQSAREAGDYDMMRQQAQTLHQLAAPLQKRDREFEDKQLEPLLSKDQKKAFHSWRDGQKKDADEERERQREEIRSRLRGRSNEAQRSSTLRSS